MTDIRFCFETLGCKVNQYETQALEAILTSKGHVASKAGAGCDAVVINTCAVTAESGRKSRQAIRRLKTMEPDAVVGVCGCFSQISADEVAALGADLVGGSGDRLGFIDALERAVTQKKARAAHQDVRVDDPRQRRVFEELPAGSASGRTRAMLKIQDGCQNFCTYCIIPYARGPVRSLPLERCVTEAERLDDAGYGEIVVTGIEISSYGKDFGDGTTLIDALRVISAAAPRTRLRLGSLEPRTMTEPFCQELRKLSNICDHFHLSLQSGCDDTLRRMKRQYTTVEFAEVVQRLRTYFPRCGITADLIVGFPGETEAEFEKTLEFIKECEFSDMHIFTYSKRPGTPASEMAGQVDKAVKQARARCASQAADEMTQAYAQSCVGSVLDVLFEQEKNGMSFGHAGNYLQVGVPETGIRNRRRFVRIICKKNDLLFGKFVKP